LNQLVISGIGFYAPEQVIDNDELVNSYNTFVQEHNALNNGRKYEESSTDFIVKASGIHRRHVIDREGILDPKRLHPRIRTRSNDEPSVQVDLALPAAQMALKNAGLNPEDIDCLILGAATLQRAYPSISIETQKYLGTKGFALDTNAACASAPFAMATAAGLLAQNVAKRALVINAEICTGHLNFRERDGHFIFGDASSAVVLEDKETMKVPHGFDVLGFKLATQFSNNIRNNFGFLNPHEYPLRDAQDILFQQQGRKVFREVVPYVSELILQHLEEKQLTPQMIKRFWLHQANKSMNDYIFEKVIGRKPQAIEAPLVLDEYGNTSGPGSIIALCKYHQDLSPGDLGVLCAFGAGYTAGSVILRKT